MDARNSCTSDDKKAESKSFICGSMPESCKAEAVAS